MKTKTEVIKFRVAASDKARLVRIAGERRATVSAILRRAAALVANGRNDDAAIRADMISIRRVANAMLEAADRVGHRDASAASDIRDMAGALRSVAAAHLDDAA
jgi:hypothetical protein